jgi:UDP-glucuronate 4-epimerase
MSSVPAAVGTETPIDEGLQQFADWVKDYYADRPVLEV